MGVRLAVRPLWWGRLRRIAAEEYLQGGRGASGGSGWMVVSELCSSEYALWYNRAVDEWLRKVAEVVAKGD